MIAKKIDNLYFVSMSGRKQRLLLIVELHAEAPYHQDKRVFRVKLAMLLGLPVRCGRRCKRTFGCF
jgi:hypothetical protein